VIGRKPPERERSPEERAAAAAERAARRGETGNNPSIPPAADVQLPPAKPLEPETGPPPELAEPTVPAAPALRPAPVAAPKPAPAAPPPVPPRRALPARPSARRPAPPPAASPPGRWGRRILALLALIVVGGALWLIFSTFQPGHGEGTGAVAVKVPAGSDAGEIGDLLAEKGVVTNGAFFSLNATLTGRRGKLKSGDYTFARDMSYGDALEALVQGPKAKIVKTIRFTIPEGRSRREVVPLVKKSSIEGDYLKATNSRKALRGAHALGLPRRSDNPEGFFFPATFELLAGASAADLVDRQLDALKDNLAEVDMAAAKRRNLTRYDVLIIASMVEREAQLAKERPLIAAVIHNRLREGIPLGIDATIRYAENNWSRPLRVSELERDGPYNTRLRRGLPPTPIGNPGLASLKAAANPAKVGYLFYVVKPGACGEHAFSSTDRQFSRDVAKYNAEREKAGGKSPTKC
jgi:uncharacterized YceG family protein